MVLATLHAKITSLEHGISFISHAMIVSGGIRLTRLAQDEVDRLAHPADGQLTVTSYLPVPTLSIALP